MLLPMFEYSTKSAVAGGAPSVVCVGGTCWRRCSATIRRPFPACRQRDLQDLAVRGEVPLRGAPVELQRRREVLHSELEIPQRGRRRLIAQVQEDVADLPR